MDISPQESQPMSQLRRMRAYTTSRLPWILTALLSIVLAACNNGSGGTGY